MRPQYVFSHVGCNTAPKPMVLRAYVADEDVVVDFAPAFGLRSPAMEGGCHLLHGGLSYVAGSSTILGTREAISRLLDVLRVGSCESRPWGQSDEAA
jgi:hypothetical protein